MNRRILTWSIWGALMVLGGCSEATEAPAEPSDERGGQETDADLSYDELEELDQNDKSDNVIKEAYCEQRGWTEDDICHPICGNDPKCQLPPLGPDPKGEATQYPIILIHGFMGGTESFGSFVDVSEHLRKDGHQVFDAQVEPMNAVAVRAETLGEFIDDVLQETGAAKVHLIGHSMGGLDARFVTCKAAGGRHAAVVDTITTIGTPHHGTRLADSALESGWAGSGWEYIASRFGRTYTDDELADNSDLEAALEDISTAGAKTFNALCPEPPASIYAQSFAGVTTLKGFADQFPNIESICGPRNPQGCWETTDEFGSCKPTYLAHPKTADRVRFHLKFTWDSVTEPGQPHDGMIPTRSSKWARFRGCLAADHVDQLGRPPSRRYIGWGTGFDHLRFYRNLAFELSEFERRSL